MKWTLIILLTILFATIVVADKGLIEIYKPNEILDLSVHLRNSTGEVLKANCSVQIRNETLFTVHDAIMNNIGGGWYNYTYNTSKTGKYFCRQNCTNGKLFTSGTCDFIIAGDTQMPIAVILTVLFIIVFYFIILINLFTARAFTEHGLIKLLFYMIAFWVLLLPLNMAIQFNDANGGPVVVTDYLTLLYQIMIWLNSFIMLYFFLWFIVQMINKWRGAVNQR